ncbi:MAG: serine hydrolase [Henriciella sp.]|nr:serine hydrolase [Henriciella sp.]
MSVLNRLEAICQSFVDRAGDIAVIVQSKTDPALFVAINANTPFPSASLVKVAIACAAFDAQDVDLTKTVPVDILDETFYCSILQAFEPGDQLALKSLIGLMLIVSDNPATSAILDAVGMDRVNQWLQTHGLTGTNISVGFDDASLGAPLRANLTTAEDCRSLLHQIDATQRFAVLKHMLRNNLRNERIPKLLPDEAKIAHKTGTLNGLMHDIALIESPDAAYYLIILADNLPDGHDFANDIARFSSEVYALMAD